MSGIILRKVADVASPDSNGVTLFADEDGEIYGKQTDGSLVHLTYVDEEKLKVDADATADYLGNSGSTGLVRIGSAKMTYTDGGDYVTIDIDESEIDHTAIDNIGTNSHSDIDTFIASKASANGLASLDGGGKVPASQLPETLFEYKGVWDASTNTPTLADGDTSNAGNVYRVSVAGSQDLGSGSINFEVGDYALCNDGGTWEKSDTTDAVASVNDKTGVVTLDGTDIGLTTANFDNNLSGADDNVQKALETLDELSAGGGGGGFFECTVGATGADYTTIGAAIADGNLRMLVIDDTTETADIALSNGMVIRGIGVDNVTVIIGDYGFTGIVHDAYIGNMDIQMSGTSTGGLFKCALWDSFLNTLTISTADYSTARSNYVFEPSSFWFKVRVANMYVRCGYGFWKDNDDRRHIVTFTNVYYVEEDDGVTSDYNMQIGLRYPDTRLTFNNCHFEANNGKFLKAIERNNKRDLGRVTFNSCHIEGIKDGTYEYFEGTFFEMNGYYLNIVLHNTSVEVYKGWGAKLLSANGGGILTLDNCHLDGVRYIYSGDTENSCKVSLTNSVFYFTSNNFTLETSDTSLSYEPYLYISNLNNISDYSTGLGDLQDRKFRNITNADQNLYDMGDVLVFDYDGTDWSATTTTDVDSTKVAGVCRLTDTSGLYFTSILREGCCYHVKVDGTTDIAIGDYLGTSTTAGVAQKTTTRGGAFAMALEAYTTDDANGVIKAYIFGGMR